MCSSNCGSGILSFHYHTAAANDPSIGPNRTSSAISIRTSSVGRLVLSLRGTAYSAEGRCSRPTGCRIWHWSVARPDLIGPKRGKHEYSCCYQCSWYCCDPRCSYFLDPYVHGSITHAFLHRRIWLIIFTEKLHLILGRCGPLEARPAMQSLQ